MKKLIITTVFAFTVLFANAQLKVHTNGKVSVFSTTTPNQALDVTGDISLVGATKIYRIDNQPILWHDGNTSDIFVGHSAGNSTMSGHNNNFIGFESGMVNSSGNKNLFAGTYSGNDNTTGSYNTFTGYLSGGLNMSGTYNTYNGYNAGYYSTSGDYNSFVGNQAGYNTTANYNTFIGNVAGNANTTGSYNVALGSFAGDGNTACSQCTFIGYGADATGSLTGSAAIGYNASVNLSYKIRIGNAAITVIEGQVAFTPSDGRFKFNVTEEVKGLDFIKRLRPVSYQFDTQAFDEFLNQGTSMNVSDSVGELPTIDYGPSSSIVRNGFIAQEVEQAAIECGFVTDIIHSPENERDNYSIQYGVFVVPLVKAVQEQQAKIEELEAMIRECCAAPKSLNTIQGEGTQQEQNLRNGATQVIELNYSDNVILYQNIPNPFGDETTINYYLPKTVSNATMIFYNDMGQTIKEYVLENTGNASIILKTAELTTGVYSYSLIVNGKAVETKRMVKK